MDETPSDVLRGCRLLVVEDDYMIASDVSQRLEEIGAQIVGPVGSIEHALALIEAGYPIDAAVLDINLGSTRSDPVADALHAHNVPFVFVTGYDEVMLPPLHAEVPRCEKPVHIPALARLLAERIPG
jgi:DNA-binding NtrC family response regulator